MALEALNAMLTHMRMDEDEWTKPTFDQSRKALAAIREALAEPEITTPDVCGEVCARAKLCYGCGKEFDEALAKKTPEWVDVDDYEEPSVSDGVCGGCAKTAADGWALYCVECWEKAESVNVDTVNTSEKCVDETVNNRHEPVKQSQLADASLEPVAWMRENEDCTDCFVWERDEEHTIPLYTTPPSVEAAIEATKEKAAKICDEALGENNISAAIRSMK
jgi:hypothetical protein